MSLLCFSVIFTQLNEHSSGSQYAIFAIAGLIAISGSVLMMLGCNVVLNKSKTLNI
jgi:hypothetical protein